jgi:hypothetical protein
MKKIFLLVAGCSIMAIACNSSEDNGAGAADNPASTVTENSADVSLNPEQGAEVNSLSQEVAASTTAAPAAQAATAAATTGQALNPPHGEPGHDCGLPVGAPLNSAPAPKADVKAAPQTSNPPAVQVAPTANNASSGQKLNPPHGEPGHDCAVAVGAPLNN